MNPIVFIDCETTSLRPDRRAWEIALIKREDPGRRDREASWFVTLDDLDLGNADLMSLKIGGFYDRHPEIRQPHADSLPREAQILTEVEVLTRGALVLGSNPSFDMETLGAAMRRVGICPSWHYHPVDVPTMAQGWLLGNGINVADLPQKSDDISLAVGVDPTKFDRHTAIGDCYWISDLYDAITTLGGSRGTAL